MRLKEAKQITGGLSFPSKMPCTSYSLPATACIAGAKLAKVPGTICSTCYALHGSGFYAMSNAQKGMHRRLASLVDPRWCDALVTLLIFYHSRPSFRIDLGAVGVRLQKAGGVRYRYNKSGHHRWHDAGDLQSVEHLAMICEVARRTPKIKHWLPTQELGMVKRYIAGGGAIPDNLLVRVSSVMIDDTVRRSWPHTSAVFSGKPPASARICPAPQQGHFCGSCRSCWSPSVAHVAYELH